MKSPKKDKSPEGKKEKPKAASEVNKKNLIQNIKAQLKNCCLKDLKLLNGTRDIITVIVSLKPMKENLFICQSVM